MKKKKIKKRRRRNERKSRRKEEEKRREREKKRKTKKDKKRKKEDRRKRQIRGRWTYKLGQKKKIFSGATFQMTKSGTLNRLSHCSLWQFSGALFLFSRVLFCISRAKSPGAPCHFPLIQT